MTNELHDAIPDAGRETDRARAAQTTSRSTETMAESTRASRALRLASSLALFAVLVAACSGKENPAPGDDDPITPTPTTGGSSGDSSGGSAGAGPVGSGGDGAGGTTFEEPDREDCADEPDGEQPDSHPASHRGTPCWDVADCRIVSPEQVINQCNSKGSSCFPFTRSIEGHTPGDPLPPL